MERETGFEPATNSLEGCDSTPELLPPGELTADRGPNRFLRPRYLENSDLRCRGSVPRMRRSMVEADGFEPP